MRTFHLTWFAFFLAFFGWFGIAPMMALVRDDLGLTRTQIGNTIIASVAITILARLLIGWLCDRIGPRLAYSGLLVLGSIPVMCIGLAQNYETFLLFRLAIGVIGASFVITQYHTSVMFAPNVVGAANATTAGWGNMGGGVTQIVMPLVLTLVLMLGVNEALGWRVAMVTFSFERGTAFISELLGTMNQLAEMAELARGIRRNGYVISEVGKPPDLAMEVGSRSTGRRDYTVKREGYAALSIREYWRFDPSGGEHHDRPLAGDTLVDGEYVPMEIVVESDDRHWGYSEVLGLELWWEEETLRFRDPVSGEFLLTPEEERAARESAEARVAELEAELRRLRCE